MKRRAFTNEEINNTLDFLILIENNYKSGEALAKLWSIARAHKVPLYTGVVRAMKDLKYITAIGNRNLKVQAFNLPSVTREHAEKLLKRINLNQVNYSKNIKKLKETFVPEDKVKQLSEKIKKVTEPITAVNPVNIIIESTESITFTNAIVIIQGIKIEGTFKLTELR